jgi:hypothetical protein
MKTKLSFLLGGLCILLAVIYGFSGQLVPSIQHRGALISRWETEMVKDKREVEKLLAEADRLGNGTSQADRDAFTSKLASVEYATRNLRARADAMDYERGRRKEMILITAGLAGFGVLAIALGLWLRRRSALHADVSRRDRR